ncbi:MAG: hypothetical protein RSF93_02920 [Mucinivorans sp.]
MNIVIPDKDVLELRKIIAVLDSYQQCETWTFADLDDQRMLGMQIASYIDEYLNPQCDA